MASDQWDGCRVPAEHADLDPTGECPHCLLSEVERLRTVLAAAREWMAEDGCDCGTDEPGTCALCQVEAAVSDGE